MISIPPITRRRKSPQSPLLSERPGGQPKEVNQTRFEGTPHKKHIQAAMVLTPVWRRTCRASGGVTGSARPNLAEEQSTELICRLMPIKYIVPAKTILLCNFDMGGFKAPEMTKRRPAVVLSGRIPRRDNLVAVVPLSGTESDKRNQYHCRLELDLPLPEPFAETVWWAKGDMVATVSLGRLDLFHTERGSDGRRQYLTNLKVTDEDFERIKEAVRHGLNLH